MTQHEREAAEFAYWLRVLRTVLVSVLCGWLAVVLLAVVAPGISGMAVVGALVIGCGFGWAVTQ